jgi:hypothetical protein
MKTVYQLMHHSMAMATALPAMKKAFLEFLREEKMNWQN